MAISSIRCFGEVIFRLVGLGCFLMCVFKEWFWSWWFVGVGENDFEVLFFKPNLKLFSVVIIWDFWMLFGVNGLELLFQRHFNYTSNDPLLLPSLFVCLALFRFALWAQINISIIKCLAVSDKRSNSLNRKRLLPGVNDLGVWNCGLKSGLGFKAFSKIFSHSQIYFRASNGRAITKPWAHCLP